MDRIDETYTNDNFCNQGCTPPQIITFNEPFEKIPNKINIYNKKELILLDNVLFSYSIDNVCWTEFNSYNITVSTLNGVSSDFFLKIKVKDYISKVLIDCNEVTNYNIQLAKGFDLTNICDSKSTNVYNPYNNLECAISLQQQLADNIACIVGIPIYYFKVNPEIKSKDITFKEYCLFNIETIKYIKLIIKDGQMPSSKPNFNDFGIDFENDWETEISKTMFANAFGLTVQPQEGDIIYIPMMDRLWQVSYAYDEKKDGLMWHSTTFKVMLVKYQERANIQTVNSEISTNIDEIVKNKYEDLFGNNEGLSSQEQTLESPIHASTGLFDVFEQDATRKSLTIDFTEFTQNNIYYKGVLLSDSQYNISNKNSIITYQKHICGDNYTISFIIKPLDINGIYNIINVGKKDIILTVSDKIAKISYINNEINIDRYNWNYITINVNKELNVYTLKSYKYTNIDNIPIYKLQKFHYYFDLDNIFDSKSSNWTLELHIPQNSELITLSGCCLLTNIKFFNKYILENEKIIKMNPNDINLIINDTARKVFDRTGYLVK